MLYSGLLLTAVNLLLRFSGTAFQVYLSGAVGASGVGLIHLVMSVGNLATVAGMAGVRTAAMYLTAEERGKKSGHAGAAVSGCFTYGIVCSTAVALTLYVCAPRIARGWIGNPDTVCALRLLAATVPMSCLCGVLCGYFTAIKRIGTLAAVEVAEQAVSLCATVLLSELYAKGDSVKAACGLVIGGAVGTAGVLLCLFWLYCRAEKGNASAAMGRRIRSIALPLAAADVLRSGIASVESMMVPKLLALYTADALGAFGTVTGMVFPVLMFPACLLFGLCELLIPELAECNSGSNRARISYLSLRSLRLATVYGCGVAAVMGAVAVPLCEALYHNESAGMMLGWYALLLPMLYCDMVIDSMVKGLGHHRANVRYNILTNTLDVVFLFFLLPRCGMKGYFVSFALTHVLNFCLSLRRLMRTAEIKLRMYVPILCYAAMLSAIFLCRGMASPILSGICAFGSFAALCVLTGIVGKEDCRWVLGFMHFSLEKSPQP